MCSNAPADLASVEREIYGFVRIFAIFLIFCSTDARSAGAYTHDFLQLPLNRVAAQNLKPFIMHEYTRQPLGSAIRAFPEFEGAMH